MKENKAERILYEVLNDKRRRKYCGVTITEFNTILNKIIKSNIDCKTIEYLLKNHYNTYKLYVIQSKLGIFERDLLITTLHTYWLESVRLLKDNK